MKYVKKIIVLIISLIFVLLFILQIVLPKKEFSSKENRMLATFPTFTFKRLYEGNYIKELEDYLVDHFPFRDMFMNIHLTSERILLKDEVSDVYFAKDGYLIEKYNKPVNTEKLIDKLNKFYEKLNYVNMNLMLVPTNVQINKDLLPNNSLSYDELATIKEYYDNINFDYIDVTNTLKEHNNDYQMFYKLDHHWTSYAAYYAYKEYAKNNNIDYIDISKFSITKVTDSFRGTLSSKTSDYLRKSDSIYKFSLNNEDITVKYVDTNIETNTLYADKYLKEKDKYSYFLDNNHSLIEITNNNIKGNNDLLVIKDSYANSLIPFLVNHYHKVYVIDPRYYRKSISDYVLENPNIKNILFVYNMISLDTDSGIKSVR